MKLGKTQVCLYIYEQLLKNGSISSEEIKTKFDLCDKTFSRYISELRCYLVNFFKNVDIVYVKKENNYLLVSDVNE